ncbi:tyrosine-type recombinase/integrase [Gordonia humi]|uniref:tyrosine-type recombinase/integrase n=1 Tax=Gordonia humi TaxID=686429 RepID=UPI00361154DD
MIGTGARIGEVLALRWEDIDFENRTVTIAGTITAQGDRQPHKKNRRRTSHRNGPCLHRGRARTTEG